MNLKTGKYFKKNQQRLSSLTDIDDQWATALEKCRAHIKYRLKRRTSFGAHAEARLGENALDYYISYAYEAILSGRWEWKDNHTLSEQMILIADSTISTEVDKMDTKKATENKIKSVYDDIDTLFYDQDPVASELGTLKQILIDREINLIEDTVKGDTDLESFWECVKDGMKRMDIAAFMEKTAKQVDKIRERFIKTIKASSYFEKE